MLAACGGSKSASPSTSAAPPPPPPKTTTQIGGNTGSKSGGTAALKAEAVSKATGDIPDNQVFLTFRNSAAGYSIVYPEGWAQSGSGDTVTIRDKNNIIRVVVTNGSPPSLSEVKSQVAKLRGAKKDDRPLLLQTQMGAGHSGPSGRYESWREEAFVTAFVLSQLDVEAT